MTTVDLTAGTFEQTVRGNDIVLAAQADITSIPTLLAFRENVLVFAQPGALPAAALEQVISGVRGLDMDDVRAQIAARQAAS